MNGFTKKDFDTELQPYYRSAKIISDLVVRKWGLSLTSSLFKLARFSKIKGLKSEVRSIKSTHGGRDIRLKIYRPDTDAKLPAVLYIHGGGYLIGVPEVSNGTMEEYIKRRPCVIVAPDYRKALEQPYPAALDDCYDTLLWMKQNAEALNIHAEKFAIAGNSAGGGLTAAVSLKACDTKDVEIAFQIPLYPMIDHRQTTESAKAMAKGIPGWNAMTNAIGWGHYLKKVSDDVPVYASPSLGTKHSHLPPTITFVGGLDPFKDETINYVQALKDAGVPVKFELYEKAFHGFEILASNAAVSQRANRFHFEAWEEYFDRYLKK